MNSDSEALYEQLLISSGGASRPVRASAAVVPWRRGAEGEIEVFWVRRSPTMRFMGGWHAFPGGGLARTDAAVEIDGHPAGASESTFTPAEPEMSEAQLEAWGRTCPLGSPSVPSASCSKRPAFYSLREQRSATMATCRRFVSVFWKVRISAT